MRSYHLSKYFFQIYLVFPWFFVWLGWGHIILIISPSIVMIILPSLLLVLETISSIWVLLLLVISSHKLCSTPFPARLVSWSESDLGCSDTTKCNTPFPTRPDWQIQIESRLLAEFIYQNIYKKKTFRSTFHFI